MASKTKTVATKEKEMEEALEKEAADAPGTSLPLLDLIDTAVKKLIRTAKKRGFVTHDQIDSLSKEVSSEQIEDILTRFSEMGVNVVETEEAAEEGEEAREEPDEEAESESGELVEVQQKVPAKAETKEPTERTDDPVRMYLREMGSVELLSREGEIAIAKRIEAGREAMIAGLCESPLTFEAIIIWRDELNEHLGEGQRTRRFSGCTAPTWNRAVVWSRGPLRWRSPRVGSIDRSMNDRLGHF